MLTMLKCDLTCLRGMARSSLVVALLVAVVLVVSMGTSLLTGFMAALGALTAVLTLTSLSSLMAYVDQNSWQAFRLAMPVTRWQVVCGRYATGLLCAVLSMVAAALLMLLAVGVASVLDGSASLTFSALCDSGALGPLTACAALSVAAPLLMLALTLPFVFRFGYGRGFRYVMAGAAALVVAMIALGDRLLADGAVLAGTLDALEDPGTLLMLGAAALLAALVLYALSCVVSVRLYRGREL